MNARSRLLTLTLLVFWGAGAAAQVFAGGELAFTDSGDLAIDVNDGRGEIHVGVVNTGEMTTVTWSIVLSPTEDGTAAVASIEPEETDLTARTTAFVELVVTGVSPDGKLDGVLVGTPKGGAPFTRPITISKFGLALPINVASVLALALGASLLLVVARYFKLDRTKCKGPLVNPKWSFSTSWASTFTGAGALLATLVSAGALPEEPFLLGKEDFAGLGLFFGALGLLAPVVFMAFNHKDAKAPVFVFHAATWLTTAGVIGQLTTLLLLLVDALGQASSSLLVVILGLVEIAGVLLILKYVYRAIPETIVEAAKTGSAALPTTKRSWSLL